MSKDKKKKPKEVTRRQFLAGTGIVVGGAAIGSAALLAACGGDGETETVTQTVTITAPGTTTTQTVTVTVPGPGEVEGLVNLSVNGENYELQVEPTLTLAEVIRDKIGLTGTKVACDRAECGACTVLVDGQPTLSCTMLGVEADGSEIETVEGLANGWTLHPLQTAFIENFGLQCGYCTPGIILVAKALLSENPNPTEEDVREALAGNICKCGDYKQIIASVLAAAAKIKIG